MKKIGLIGGVSWTSTLEYYKRLNEGIYNKLGGFHSAEILLYSFNFDEILKFQATNDAEGEANLLIESAQRLEKAGADFILICSNTTSKTSEDIQKNIAIPLVNLIEATAQEARKQEFKTVGLLGTKYTMYGDFYRKYFNNVADISLIVPEKERGMKVHDIIYDELVKGTFLNSSKKYMAESITDLANKGAEAVILGCTEIPLIVDKTKHTIPLLDTIQIHVDKAIELALADTEVTTLESEIIQTHSNNTFWPLNTINSMLR